MTRRRYAALALAIIVFVPILGFLSWAADAAAPMSEALAVLTSDDQVHVDTSRWLAFRARGSSPTAGLIFYPGARVDARAYAPSARAIAAQGHLVVIVPMPLNLAVLGANRAADVMQAYPEIRQWAISGHSLGGVMAARFAREHEELIRGLILWASYPAAGDDLSGLKIIAASIYGTRDSLTRSERVQESQRLLPTGTVWTAIEGGNHAQFGWYGEQEGDAPAAISREEQQRQIVAATVELLRILR